MAEIINIKTNTKETDNNNKKKKITKMEIEHDNNNNTLPTINPLRKDNDHETHLRDINNFFIPSI